MPNSLKMPLFTLLQNGNILSDLYYSTGIEGDNTYLSTSALWFITTAVVVAYNAATVFYFFSSAAAAPTRQ